MKMRPLVRAWCGSRPLGYLVSPHAHDEAQLIYAASGALQVYTDHGRWLVPPQLAVWIPSGTPHSIEFLSATELWTLYWKPSAVRAWTHPNSLRDAFAMRVTTLLRELILAALSSSSPVARAELVATLILHELIETPNAPTFLPTPSSELGRRIAEVALADFKLDLDTEMIAHRTATSVRTISRLFPKETGLTFRAWRQRARLILSMNELARGRQISLIAAQCGFANTAAFSFAFRQMTGITPTAFIREGTLTEAPGGPMPLRSL